MNLAKALKLKSRLVQKIAALQTDIQGHNSKPEGQERKIDVQKLMEQLNTAVHNLVVLKIVLFEASAPMRETILTLAETKSRIIFLKGIDTHEGKVRKTSYGITEDEISSEVVFDISWVRAEIEEAEEKVDKFQDELDTFNHRTEVSTGIEIS